MGKKRLVILVLSFILIVLIGCFRTRLRFLGKRLLCIVRGRATVLERVEQYGAAGRHRMHPYFRKSGIDYPPKKIVLIGLKREKLLEVWASMEDSRYSLVRTYPILSTSGEPGPKLQEGDGQMPEGFYRIESLNPNSSYHLSLRINYPNDFDLRHARREGRTNPGGDIMIHGGRASLGCLAMGDRVAEELFVLAADVGVKNIRVIMSPVDFRKGAEVVSRESMPPWTDELYAQIKSELEVLQTDAGR